MAIYGKISEIIKQNKFESNIRLALEYLTSLDKERLSYKQAGYFERIEIKGNDIFALHQVNKTKPAEQARFESHRKYIDLQYILKGEELISVVSTSKLKIIIPYDREKDTAFYTYFPSASFIMEPGVMAILYPCDAHAPGIVFKKQRLVRKVVVKVKS